MSNSNTNTIINNTKYNSIYKVNYLVNGIIDTIFVFFGKNIVQEDQKKLIIQKIFTEQEIDNINQNNIHVEFLEEQIQFDDTIGTINVEAPPLRLRLLPPAVLFNVFNLTASALLFIIADAFGVGPLIAYVVGGAINPMYTLFIYYIICKFLQTIDQPINQSIKIKHFI